VRARRLSNALAVGGVMLGVALVMSGTSASAEDAKRVRLLDDCDVASFNAAFGPGTCVGDGRTTVDDFVAQLTANGNVPNKAVRGWAFKPGSFHIDAGDHIDAVSRGGEFHTFTEVANFGGGCIPQLNVILGLSPVPECDAVTETPDGPVPTAFITTGVAPGGQLPVAGLSPGEHKFQCLIHPWMESVVDVRADDHGGHGED
jgi:plastocyanin